MPITYGYQRDIMFNRVNVVPNFDKIEIITVIFCSLSIDKDRLKEKILDGSLELESSGDTNYLVLDGSLTFERSIINNDILKGRSTIAKEISDKVLFNGNLTYEASDYISDLLNGSIDYEINQLNDDNTVIVQGSTEIEEEELEFNVLNGIGYHDLEQVSYIIMNGLLDLENSEYEEDFQGLMDIVKVPYHNNIIKADMDYEKQPLVKDLLLGYTSTKFAYTSKDIKCKVKVPITIGVHQLLGTINVVDSLNWEIAGRIAVFNASNVNTVLIRGEFELEKEDNTLDLFNGYITDIIPRLDITFDGTAILQSVYTQRDIVDGVLDVVLDSSTTIPCSIEVVPEVKKYEGDILYWYSYTGDPKYHSFYGTVEVLNYNPDDDPPKSLVPVSRIVVAVSPTWRYEPKVFQDTMITFFNRYHGKRKFNIVYGGNPRSDYDIRNYAAAYHIPKDQLTCCPIIVDPHNPDNTRRSVLHFLNTMLTFNPDQPNYISRVFLFLNQPMYYITDPLAPIADFCKKNNISCVAISSGGEYQEITEYDRRRDQALNDLAYDRLITRYNVPLPTSDVDTVNEFNPDRITY